MSTQRFRGWTYTINNYTDDIIKHLNILDCQYNIYGKEVGENGTPHLQGFIFYTNKKSFKQVKKDLPTAHIEKANNIDAAINYCKKDDNIFEKGTPPMTVSQKGAKGKEFWDNTLSLAKSNKLDEIDSKVLISHYNTLKTIARDYATAPKDLPTVCGIWIYGPPGTGKSHAARNNYGNFYLKETNKWWDSYRNEPTVIIDEVEKDAAKYIGHYLKKWADRYAFDAEVKGSKLIIRPEHIIVTSNYSIEEVFNDDTMMCQAIQRRFKTIYMDQPYREPEPLLDETPTVDLYIESLFKAYEDHTTLPARPVSKPETNDLQKFFDTESQRAYKKLKFKAFSNILNPV